MTKKFSLFAICLFCLVDAFAQLNVTTDRPNCRYEVGEQMAFLVNNTINGNATYVIRYDDLSDPIQTGNIVVEAGISTPIYYTSNEPNHVVCEISMNSEYGKAGANFDCFDMQPLEERPADFKSFWDNQISASNNIPLDPQISYLTETEYSTSYKIDIANIEGKRLYGYISVPKGTGPFPAIITFPPFGTDPSIVIAENVFSEWSNCISVSISIHNVPVDEVDPNAYLGEVITDRDQIYFKSGLVGAVRIADYLYTRSDFDQTNICSYGVSQGGGLAMLYAGIDERVDVLMTTNPSLCEHVGLHYNRASGFPFYVNKSRGENGTAAHELQTIEATKYYDAVHAASFFDGPTLMSISYLDGIAPGAASFTAFNQLTKNFKIMISAPKLAHNNANEFWQDKFKMLNNVWPDATANQPFPWAEAATGHFIDAGNNFSVEGMNASLSGNAVKDGVSVNSWPVKWKKISGPGIVSFSNPDSYATDVTFESNGTYVLKFSADDDITYSDQDIYYTIEDFVEVEVSGIVASNENIEADNALSIVLSPNPVKNEITLEFSNPINLNQGEFLLYNSQGQLVQQFNNMDFTNDRFMQFSTSSLKNGYYIMIYNNNSTQIALPFVKID